MNLLTISAYARHRGVSQPAVTQAVQAGRISVIEKNGRKWIDPAVADIQWRENTRPRFRDPEDAASPVSVPEAVLDSPAAVGDLHDIRKARAKREHHEANLAEMRDRREAKQLVERERVKKSVVDAGALLRTALEQIASKLGAQLAVEDDPAVCRALVSAEVDAALEDATANLRRMAEDS